MRCKQCGEGLAIDQDAVLAWLLVTARRPQRRPWLTNFGLYHRGCVPREDGWQELAWDGPNQMPPNKLIAHLRGIGRFHKDEVLGAIRGEA